MAKIEVTSVGVQFSATTNKRKFFPSILKTKTEPTAPSRSVIENITFSLSDGDKVGLLGRNGAGKTTILRVLAQILKPTIGEVYIEGEVGALFGAIPFMNPTLSARRNMVNYLAVAGIVGDQAKELISDVEEFIEIGEYFDMPIQIYSSGMLAKFNFSLLTAFDKEILLLDEGIGAGDFFFSQKINTRLDRLYSSAKILVMASHSNDMIKQLCNKCIILSAGKIVKVGNVDECLDTYITGVF